MRELRVAVSARARRERAALPTSRGFAYLRFVGVVVRLVSLSMVALLACACGSIPEGVFECSRDQECPHGWFCRADSRCYASPGDGMDAGPQRDAGPRLDAGADAATCPASCDDGNICTDDSCDENSGFECTHAPNSAECSLGDPCVQTYQCIDESCVATLYLADGSVVNATSLCCGMRVVNVTSDPFNCGSCGTVCNAGQTCFNRACQNQ